MKTTVAVLTVVYNNYTILDDFFASFNKQKEKNFVVYVADLSTKPQQYTYPKYVKYFTSQNKGYAHGINEVLKRALQEDIQRFCVINCDVIVAANFMEEVTTAFDKYPGTIIGGKIYYAKGYEYHKKRYSDKELGNIIWFAGGKIDWKNVYTTHRGVDQFDNGQFDQSVKTDFITGCLMLFDATVVDEVGFWDENYFLYYEDSDYCVRAAKKGIPLMYEPSIVIWHKNAQSTDGSGSKLHQHYQEKNRLMFGLSYAPWKTKLHLLKNKVFPLQ